jgi:hypothetical protein
MRIRRVISLTVLLSFFFLALSGIMLFISPQGRVAYWAGWTLFGLTKDQYSAIHTTFMVLFITVGIWHIVLNWKPIVGYLKNRTKRVRIITPESSLALLLALAFLVGPLAGLPPFRQFLDAGVEVKEAWETRAGSPPWGHAEENSLLRFCRGMEDFERLENQSMVAIDCDQALEYLRSRGMLVEGTNQRLMEIAETNATTPQAVASLIMEVARPLTPQEAAGAVPSAAAARFQRPYTGLGRMTLEEYAREYAYELGELQRILLEAGLELDPGIRLRDEAARLGLDPEGIIDVLNGDGTSPSGHLSTR